MGKKKVLAAALFGSGMLFLIEAGMGLFKPQPYSIVERSSREKLHGVFDPSAH